VIAILKRLKSSLFLDTKKEEVMKKEYIAPEMESVDLKTQSNLILCGSGDSPNPGEIEGDTGYAPFKQDPLA
jgi:hypothetical protein